MTAPVREVITAHRTFVAAVADLSHRDLARPTALPGWTVGHVIAHVADGGRAFANLTELALKGELTALFPGGLAERNGTIERLATSPDLLAHLEDGMTRLEKAWSRATPEDSQRPVRFRNGTLAGTVYTRWREVWIHLIDCEVGVTPTDWPTGLAAHSIDFLRSRLPAGIALQATDTGQHWPATPPAGSPAVTEPVVGVSGPLAAGNSAPDWSRPTETVPGGVSSAVGVARGTVVGGVRDLAAWLAGRAPVHDLSGPAVELGEWPPHPTPDR
jgi:maleylpyruvate isomerase